jgi:hypothetical protein
MKNFRYLFLALIGTFLISSCNDNDVVPGNPVMESKRILVVQCLETVCLLL